MKINITDKEYRDLTEIEDFIGDTCNGNLDDPAYWNGLHRSLRRIIQKYRSAKGRERKKLSIAIDKNN